MGGRVALATTARQQLIEFYRQIGLPTCLIDLNLGDITLRDLQQAAEFACQEGSDIHHLPFAITPDALMAAMVSPLSSELRPRSWALLTPTATPEL